MFVCDSYYSEDCTKHEEKKYDEITLKTMVNINKLMKTQLHHHNIKSMN